ncbi:MAG: PAS domain S-box protein [Chitinophagaceae bacterium]
MKILILEKPIKMYKQLQECGKWLKNKGIVLFVLFFSTAIILVETRTIPGTTIIAFYSSIVFALLGGLSFWSSQSRVARLKKISNELKQQRELFRTTLSSIAEGLITTGKNGEVLYMNPAAEFMTGWKHNDALQLPVEKVFQVANEETGESVDNIVNRILSHGNAIEWENNTVLKSKTAGNLVINNSGSPVLDVKGKLAGAVLVFSDTSENKVIENKLKEREKQYRDLIQNLPEAVYTCDEYGYLQLYNKAAVRLWGREPKPGDDVWCGSWKMFNPNGTDLPLENSPMAICLKNGKPAHGKEVMIQRPDENCRLVIQYPSPLFNAEGQLTGAINMLLDVTDNKEREIIIKHTEEKYRNLIEQASDAILIYSFDGTIHEFNKSCYTMLGYTAEEYGKLKLTDFLVEDIIVDQDNYAAILGGDTKTIYRNLKRKDGSLVVAEVSVKMLTDGKAIAIARDITERRNAEQALEQSIKRFELVTKATSDMIWDWNLVTGEVYRSKEGWEQIFGSGGDEDGGTEGDWESRIHPDDLEGVSRIKQELFNSPAKDFFETECRIRRGDGTWAYIHDKGYIIRNEEGKAIRLVGASSDITEKKIAEEELKSSEERYRHLFNNNPESILIWDVDSLNILEVNDTAVQEYGYPREEFTELTLLDLRPPEEHEKIKTFAKKMKENPVRYAGIWRHCNKAGEDIYMSIVSDQISYKEKTAILAIADNVTEKIKLEAKLENERILKEQEIKDAVLSAQENERRAIGQELHDHINQLLATSRLYLGLVRKEKGDSTSLEEADNLIFSAITDIRSLSHSLIPPAVSESALEEALEDIIGRISETTEIAVHKNYSGFEENMISDKFKLTIYRIVQEQFSNIIKYAQAKNIHLDLLQKNDKIILSIKDDGVGFNTTLGTDGIGLLNIRTRASLFAGVMSIISSPGNGCEIRVVFPFMESSNN